jgi:carboxyl-terminal processing protease
MPKLPKFLLLAASVALVITVFLGLHTSSVLAASGLDSTPQQDGGAYRQINVYSEVLRHIQSDYVTDPNIETVTDGALRGLLESLDADSSYLSPTDYKAYKEDAARPGKAQVGLVVSKRGGYANIISVIPGSPADKAGLVDGQFIEAINGKDTHDISLAVIQMMLSGTPGSQVTVSIVRGGKPVPDKVDLTRTIVAEPAVYESLYEGSSILYLKPVILDHDHVQAIEAKLKNAEKTGNKKVLLDLRDVAGGDMIEATRLANFFLKSGTIATLEGQKITKVTYTADAKQAIDPSAAMVVLVNRGTAGPGELVAAALADDKRAQLVGEKTFGEGTQTKLFELPDGAALILSIAKYGTPAGKKLEDDGVTPEVLVASNIDAGASDGGDDEDDATATRTAPPTPPANAKPSADDQLNKGLELLKAKPV